MLSSNNKNEIKSFSNQLSNSTINQNIPSYTCINCGQKQNIKPKDLIKCKSCGHKIFFKNRFPKSSFYLAR